MLLSSGVGPVVLFINAFCLFLMLYHFNRVSVMHIGITLASLASLVDVGLTLVSGGRYMVGWYVARCSSLVASLALLCVLLAAITRLYRTLVVQQSRISYLAYRDPLTGLANRRSFSDTFERISEAGNNRLFCGMLMLDLDGFKQVNDSFGHEVGDLLLRNAADRVIGSVREQDVVARLGGDEFILLLSSPVTVTEIETIAKRIIDTLQQPMTISDNAIQVTASVGIALRPADGRMYRDLLRNADQALYRAKDMGKNRYAFYSM